MYKILFFVSLIVLLLYINSRKIENFKNKKKVKKNSKKIEFPQNGKDDITNLLNKANYEITSNPDDWIIYNASKKNSIYVITKENDLNILYNADIETSNNLKTYTIKNNKNIYLGTRGTQTTSHSPSIYGTFSDKPIKIDYKRGYQRLNINIGNGETVIKGYGGFEGDVSYTSPWHTVIPIVYTEGGSIIAKMDYVGKINNVTSSTTYLPLEIIISSKYQDYVQLFFQIYVLFQDYISSLN